MNMHFIIILYSSSLKSIRNWFAKTHRAETEHWTMSLLSVRNEIKIKKNKTAMMPEHNNTDTRRGLQGCYSFSIRG